MAKKRIMVADDDPAIVEAVQLMLEDAGYEVTTSRDGLSVLRMQEGLPDVLLLDVWIGWQGYL